MLVIGSLIETPPLDHQAATGVMTMTETTSMTTEHRHRIVPPTTVVGADMALLRRQETAGGPTRIVLTKHRRPGRAVTGVSLPDSVMDTHIGIVIAGDMVVRPKRIRSSL